MSLKRGIANRQIILESSDPDFCVFLNIGLYLESQFPTKVNGKGILNFFSLGGSNTANTKKKVSRVMRDIFKSDEFRTAFGDGKGLDGQKLLEWLIIAIKQQQYLVEQYFGLV